MEEESKKNYRVGAMRFEGLQSIRLLVVLSILFTLLTLQPCEAHRHHHGHRRHGPHGQRRQNQAGARIYPVANLQVEAEEGMGALSGGLFDLVEKQIQMDDDKKNGRVPEVKKEIPQVNIMELKRKLQEKLIRAEIEARMSKDEAQEALTEQLSKMDKDEQTFGYESTNLYKFDEADQSKIMDELTGDEGQQMAEHMLDSMSSLQMKEDLRVRSGTRRRQLAKKRHHRRNRLHQRHGGHRHHHPHHSHEMH